LNPGGDGSRGTGGFVGFERNGLNPVDHWIRLGGGGMMVPAVTVDDLVAEAENNCSRLRRQLCSNFVVVEAEKADHKLHYPVHPGSVGFLKLCPQDH
jgi:hypothetical protein